MRGAGADRRPRRRFRAIRAKEIIGEVLKEKLTGAVYHADNTGQWAREISDDIKRLIKGGWTETLESCGLDPART